MLNYSVAELRIYRLQMLATCKGFVKNPAFAVFAYHDVETFQSGTSECRLVDNLHVAWNIYLFQSFAVSKGCFPNLTQSFWKGNFL